MHTPLQNYMNIGAAVFLSFPETAVDQGTVFEAVRTIACDPFFTAIELSWIGNSSVRERVQQLVQASGLVVGYGAQPQIHVGKLNLAGINEQSRQHAVEQVIALLDDASKYGAAQFTIFDGLNSFPGEGQEADALAALEASVLEICHYATKHTQMKINLEAHDRCVDKCSLVGPTALAAQLAKRVRQQYSEFGLTVNLSHLPLLGETPVDSLEAVKDVLSHVYLGNCVVSNDGRPDYGDRYPRFGYEYGEIGVEELAEFLEVLLDIGFLDARNRELPVVTFAVRPIKGEDPFVVLAGAKRALSQAWRLI